MMSVVDLRKSFVAPNGERIEVLRGVTFAANADAAMKPRAAATAMRVLRMKPPMVC